MNKLVLEDIKKKALPILKQADVKKPWKFNRPQSFFEAREKICLQK